MPTPLGHAIVGAAVAMTMRASGSERDRAVVYEDRSLTIACVIAALLPDADILFGTHRAWTHSLTAAITFALIVAAIARAARWPVARIATACGAAYASHVFLDWLGKDTATPRGVMALWPISHAYFISGVDVFSEVSRRYWKPDEFIWGNMRSVAIELLVLGPPCAAIWWWRKRHRSSAADPP